MLSPETPVTNLTCVSVELEVEGAKAINLPIQLELELVPDVRVRVVPDIDALPSANEPFIVTLLFPYETDIYRLPDCVITDPLKEKLIYIPTVLIICLCDMLLFICATCFYLSVHYAFIDTYTLLYRSSSY
jgi:hypothetical protein